MNVLVKPLSYSPHVSLYFYSENIRRPPGRHLRPAFSDVELSCRSRGPLWYPLCDPEVSMYHTKGTLILVNAHACSEHLEKTKYCHVSHTPRRLEFEAPRHLGALWYSLMERGVHSLNVSSSKSLLLVHQNHTPLSLFFRLMSDPRWTPSRGDAYDTMF